MYDKNISTNQLVNSIIKGIQEKKGIDLIQLDLRELDNAVCDYFIVCNGESNTQVDAISNSVEKIVKEELNETVWHKSGYENSQWLILDYASVVVHIFQKQTRDFYKLEELWADANHEYIYEYAIA